MPPYVNPITQPYGDISTFQAPHLDNTINMLYQERKQQQAKREAELAAIDDDMNKEYSKVRSQDIPEFTNAWADYKKAKQNILFNKSLQRDPVAFQAAKRAADLAYGNVYQVGNGSAEYKDHLKGVQEWAKTHPEELPDNYGTLMTTAMNLKAGDNPNVVIGKNPDGTPITKNLRDPLTFRELTPTYNFATKIDKAAGTPQPTGFDNTPIGTKGLQVGRQEYKSTANPVKIRQEILNTYGDGDAKKSKSAKKTAADLSRTVSDEDYDKLEQAYLSRNPDDLRKQGEKLVKFDTPQTPEERYANIAAMRYGVSKTHTLGDYKQLDDKGAEIDANAEKQMRLASFSSSLRMAEQEHSANVKDAHAKGTEVPLLDIYTPIKTVGDKLGIGHEIPINVLPASARDILVNVAKKSYDAQQVTNVAGKMELHQVPINIASLKLKYNADGTVNLFTVKEVKKVYKDGTKKVTHDVDVDLGNLTKEDLNLLATKGVKERAEQIGNINEGSQPTPVPKSAPATNNFKGKKYVGLDASGNPIFK